MTVSATVGSSLVACGGDVLVQSNGSGGASSSSATNGATVTSGQTTVASGVSVGSGGSSPGCPPEPPPYGSSACAGEVPVGTVCSYVVPCQSGERSLDFVCAEYSWEMVEGQACTLPFDSCPNTDFYCNGDWILPQGTNPPAPCPSTRPKTGEVCFSGGFGIWPACGYYCDDKTTWTTAECVMPRQGVDGEWSFDGACNEE